ncbi:MAG: AMP-binding protein [bacterium]
METITIADLLSESAAKYSANIAFQSRVGKDYRQLTFLQAANFAAALQVKLAELGVLKGERVALLSENRPEWAISYLAITSLGAIVVPLDAMLSKDDLLPLIDDSGSKVIILSKNYLDFIAGTRLENSKISMEEILSLHPYTPTAHTSSQVSQNDTAAIVYTSGTTGLAKGVVLTHKNIMSNVAAVSSLFDLGPKDNFLSVLPLHHTFETTAGFLVPFYKGCKITFSESLKSHSLLANMQKTKVTVLCGVPLLFQLFYDGIKREFEEKNLGKLFSGLMFFSSFFKKIIGLNLGKFLFSMVHKKFGGKIRFFVSGGAAIDPSLIANFDLMGFPVLQGYGLSESSPILTCNTLKNNRLGSVGQPIPGVEIKIAGTEPVGEILAFGPNIMKGYYKRKELASRVLINGWLYTGDIGYLDEDSYLYITGRSKNVIVTSSGVNVYPEEMEAVLDKIPAVKEACVFGEEKEGGETVFAVIVPDLEYFKKQGRDKFEEVQATIAEEIAAINRRVANFKRIARFVVRGEELPKTRLKKVKRFELRKELGI